MFSHEKKGIITKKYVFLIIDEKICPTQLNFLSVYSQNSVVFIGRSP